ncbi:MAG: alpha/beta hydrolase [Bacillota bacterium]
MKLKKIRENGDIPEVRANNIIINRTARYFTLGDENGDSVSEVWFVLHGYAQLASEFIRNFEVIDDGSRLIVAPEGLSRFYIKNGTGHIGASWMTSEDRLNEIEDYLSYLSKVNDQLHSSLKKRNIKTCLLGFSQGASTATRWFEKSGINFNRLILWGGHLASDFNLNNSKYRETDISLVYGAEDKFLLPTYFEEDISNLKKHGIAYRLFSFNGGHLIDPDTLIKVASAT